MATRTGDLELLTHLLKREQVNGLASQTTDDLLEVSPSASAAEILHSSIKWAHICELYLFG
jgi:hypothetical protein